MLKVIAWKQMVKKGREREQKSRVYVFPAAENILEDLERRRSRPAKAWRAAVESISADMLVLMDGARWSQKAGCSCGCSPGFVLRSALGVDFYVDVAEEEQVAAVGALLTAAFGAAEGA